MSHIDELTVMMYIDGELTEEESAAVRNHLQSCRHCRERCQVWSADRSFFAQTFAREALPLPSLPPFIREQIDAICALHGHNRRKSFKLVGVLAALLLVLFLLAVIPAQSWLFNLLQNLWTLSQPYLLWAYPFWLRENADVLGDYLLVGSLFSAALFLVLICVAIVTGMHRQAELMETAYAKEGNQQ
ncbi:anti-sigma factor family protein [Brevibacillus marinus]|uniref:anti-sigma factor family protein n=1 Tax=Brevibacillus marinus TaxID=2496837 RepID=UPI000F81CCCE|nr:zf-HC2 domain-containing protein [Brevibacillus marinus]